MDILKIGAKIIGLGVTLVVNEVAQNIVMIYLSVLRIY